MEVFDGNGVTETMDPAERHTADQDKYIGVKLRGMETWLWFLTSKVTEQDGNFVGKGGWGSGGTSFIEPEAMAAYERSLNLAPEHAGDLMPAVHTACEDYRASAGIDLVHDQESRDQGLKIQCDLLVLWGDRAVVHRMFKPLELWQAQSAGLVSGHAVPSGHFIPEELPELTAESLRGFMV